MKSLRNYISKYLLSFAGFIFLLVVLNILLFVGTFYGVVTRDHAGASPRSMLADTAAASAREGISGSMRARLQREGIWAMFLDDAGACLWSVDLPPELPTQYTLPEAAVFSKGYLADYPVFVRSEDSGLLVLGYPKGSYYKLPGNYYSAGTLKRLPFFFAGILALDLLLLFAAYSFSKMKIVRDTGPLIAAIQTLSGGRPAALAVQGELSEVAASVNKASQILSRQNQARANWISGVSHDIRTPLSIILGHAGRIAADTSAGSAVREQAAVIQRQSVKLKELVADLNLVSQLEYEMQPLHQEPVRLSKLLRTYTADLLNAGLPDAYCVTLEIMPAAEAVLLAGDARLLARAVNNLVQNSIRHNPQGCSIRLGLSCSPGAVLLSVADDGVGLSPEKQRELAETPHYLDSTDDRLDLRHGLGLVLVRQITEAHQGAMQIESGPQQGVQVTLSFPTGSTA